MGKGIEVIYREIDFIMSDLEHGFQAVKNICNDHDPLLLKNWKLKLKYS